MLRAPRQAFILVLLLPLAGCLFRSRPAQSRMSTAQLKTATAQELVAMLNRQAAQIQSLNATVDIDTSVGGTQKGKITEYKEIRGYLLVRKPEMLRLIGLMPIVRNRAFDMVSDGQTFKLWIPPKNKFIVGRNDVVHASANPLENLRPQAIYDSLLLQPISPDTEIAVLESGLETLTTLKDKTPVLEPDYILDVIRKGVDGWYLSRKIFFNREQLQPNRVIIYNKDGWMASDVHYTHMQPYGQVTFPQNIEIWRPQEEYRISLTIVKLAVNETLTNEQFALQRPPGSELVQLDAADMRAQDGTGTTH